MWVGFLWYPVMRTLRSVAFLTIASAIVLLATYLPTFVVPWVQSAAVGSIALVLLFWNKPFRAIGTEDEEFIRALDDVNTQLNTAATEFENGRLKENQWREAVWAAMTRLTAANPPNADWAEARAEVLNLLRRRIELIDQGTISQEEQGEFLAQKERAHKRIDTARAKSLKPWRL